MDDIFGWMKAKKEDQMLQIPPLHLGPLFLQFRPDRKYAVIRVGCEGLETKFDVLPVYCFGGVCKYVFRLHVMQAWPRSREERWVSWDMGKQGVTLTRTLQDSCLVELLRPKGKDAFRIIKRIKGSVLYERVAACMHLPAFNDDSMKGEELEGVLSFTRYPRRKLDEDQFCLRSSEKKVGSCDSSAAKSISAISNSSVPEAAAI
jgi:hypothetical protein